MRDIFTLFLHAIVIIIRLGRPGGLRSVVAESVLLRHQILILNRGRKRAPNLRPSDRIIAGLCTLLMRPARVLWSAVRYSGRQPIWKRSSEPSRTTSIDIVFTRAWKDDCQNLTQAQRR